ncbi:hypothetical protein NQ318_021127 [Aromia moschata]|uniref:Uncharacterized protein n=1 Tax=Aromia moschata TaxID=1265417 RepID=A0AAV8YIF3_9CUCU|nr:hypothetical protein NQ318_021127 [Aromia moschata]
MTVIRDKQNYNYPKPNSTTSDTESLHLGSVSASDTESLNEEPGTTNRLGIFRPPPAKVSHVEELMNIKKSSGKKKIRRYQNSVLDDIGKRSVEVYNFNNDWVPADCFLTDFIKQLRR